MKRVFVNVITMVPGGGGGGVIMTERKTGVCFAC